MKKVILFGMLILLLIGCASMDKNLFMQVSYKNKELIRVYEYSYKDVYDAIISLHERRLNFDVNRKYTTEDVIYSSYIPGPVTVFYKGIHGYLFRLWRVDDAHTQVNLKAHGSMISISDNDMLDKYLSEELEYLKKNR